MLRTRGMLKAKPLSGCVVLDVDPKYDLRASS
jgi:hypothetical protein